MKDFMGENFLLSTKTAVELYNKYAKEMPIIDYHCHLSPKEIYENKRFKNITEAWLYGDHYKWRAMRSNGVDEEYITGNASDYDKFLAWTKTVPMTIGNPLYNWTHLELQRFFGINEILNEKSAPDIWEKVNSLLAQDDFTAQALIKKSKVEVVCTTDDPTDTLEYHQKLQENNEFGVKVLPSFRPDKGLEINRDGFLEWVGKLSEASGQSVTNYSEYLKALKERIEFFHSLGGRVSDHALDSMMYEAASEEEVSEIFAKGLKGEKVSLEEEKQFKSYTLTFLGEQYARLGWVMQYHMHALRNNNTRMFKQLGPDTGFDSMNDGEVAKPLCQLLDSLDQKYALPKTVLYSLNPKDNYVIGSVIGSFQGGGTPGKIQFGTAWWFNDQKDGMLDQMKALANLGLFSRFIGMLTDSRSFLSYTRHEYFRRLVCDLIGQWVENGEYPYDEEALSSIIQGICYNNAKEYFQF
ncbi:glucuronate isomerase [Metabacillus endolithicus]|uniref:Uronate isomerase n=1 Tax=Metabacillus endolithicus TaxID=1535204 RepID=A0ABW5BVD6_9BACI|nr:glucuronate isomerase [Metabacillus endolithicus]UPG62765.1 glucuronate isomerase [Metabacillus endolithicus]